MRAEFRKGEQWVVQRMHISVFVTSCTGNIFTDDGETEGPNDYLEAWKIKYRNKGWTYKPEIDGRAHDTWITDPRTGNSGTTTWRGEAIWVKKTGPGGWARGQGRDQGDPWGTLRGTTNNIDEKWHRFRTAKKRSGVKKRDYIRDFNCCASFCNLDAAGNLVCVAR
jgi:hypothetical protein